MLAAPAMPVLAAAHDLWLWIETHANIVYPLIAVVIIGLIVSALFASWKSEEMDAEKKGQLKMRVMQVMRRRISGVSAEAIAAELQVDVLVAAKLLAELDGEGMVSASGNAPIQYRIRGH